MENDCPSFKFKDLIKFSKTINLLKCFKNISRENNMLVTTGSWFIPNLRNRLLYLQIVVLIIVTSIVPHIKCQDFHAGYYSYHPVYMSDAPSPYHYKGKIPFGLPTGGFSKHGKGAPYGLTAYVVQLGGWENMWSHYYSPKSPISPHRIYGVPIFYGNNFIGWLDQDANLL